MSNDLIQLIYLSVAVGMTELELDLILSKSIQNNEKHQITGCLMLNQGLFLQYLEGPENAITSSLSRILDDPRHTNLQVIHAGRIKERILPGWSMTYKPSSDLNGNFDRSVEDLFIKVQAQVDVLGVLQFLRSIRMNFPSPHKSA